MSCTGYYHIDAPYFVLISKERFEQNLEPSLELDLDLIPLLPSGFFEIGEGVFEYVVSESMNDAVQALQKNGFKETYIK